MTSESLSAILPRVPLRRAGVRMERRPSAGDLAFGVFVVAASGLTAVLLEQGHERPALAIGLIPLLWWLIARPAIPLVLLGASLPIAIVSVVHAGSGGHISMSDLLLVVAGAAVVFTW